MRVANPYKDWYKKYPIEKGQKDSSIVFQNSMVYVRLGVRWCCAYLLQFIMVDDILVGGAALCERVQLVHVIHVTPEGAETRLEL